MSLRSLRFRMYVKLASEKRLSNVRCFPDQEIWKRTCAIYYRLYTTAFQNRKGKTFLFSCHVNKSLFVVLEVKFIKFMKMKRIKE